MLREQKGIALFLVLWVMTLLTVIVGEFCHATRTEINVTRNFKEQTQEHYIALAGMNRAIAGLVRQKRYPQNPERVDPADEESAELWRINTAIKAIPYSDGVFKVWIDNESGKADLNFADEQLLHMLLGNFDLSEEERNIIVDSILDWRDSDNLHRLNGAEDDYYLDLAQPYESKDAEFESVEELLLVRGVTPKLFYSGLNELFTVQESASSGSPGQKVPALFRKIARQKKAGGVNKINLNAASRQMLLALPGMDETVVEQITAYRQESDFKTMADVIDVIGAEVYQQIQPFVSLTYSDYYTLKAFGTVTGGDTYEGVTALIEIDSNNPKGYRVIQWLDGIASSS